MNLTKSNNFRNLKTMTIQTFEKPLRDIYCLFSYKYNFINMFEHFEHGSAIQRLEETKRFQNVFVFMEKL